MHPERQRLFDRYLYQGDEEYQATDKRENQRRPDAKFHTRVLDVLGFCPFVFLEPGMNLDKAGDGKAGGNQQEHGTSIFRK